MPKYRVVVSEVWERTIILEASSWLKATVAAQSVIEAGCDDCQESFEFGYFLAGATAEEVTE